jgi:hypothetical protein
MEPAALAAAVRADAAAALARYATDPSDSGPATKQV